MSGIPAGAGSLLGQRLGKYEILALLALGGTAEIYLARIGGAAGFEKYVVVKCLHDHLADDQEFVKMFLDEARLAAHLDHSNIVQTMELGEHENRYYMVMEFLAGMSLAMTVRRAGERLPQGLLPAPLALNLIAQASAGLHYAHERAVNGKQLNIVHRDISPQNLVVSFEGVVKVVDFGIAKAELRETKTKSGTIKGKFAYMSPEQCIAANVDRRTDVFALGVIAHELLTGQRLFKRPSPYETYQAVIDCAVQPPSKINIQLDPALDGLIMRAVAKDKDARYPTAEAFGDALLGYLHHRAKPSGPGEVSRFFEKSFAQEIEEHSARMRELISGREVSVDTAVSWGDEDEKRHETVDLGGRGSEMSLYTSDMIVDRPSTQSLMTADLDTVLGGGGDEGVPAEKTRIEANPLERLAEMDKAAAAQPQRNTGSVPRSPVVAPAPAASQPKPPVMPPSGALPLPAPPSAPAGPVMRPSSQRYPAAAQVPTVLAPEHANTQLGALPIDPNAPALDQPSVVVAPLGVAPRASVPDGYPVMSAEMSAQIARGADVFPSDSHRGAPQPPPSDPSQRTMMDPSQAANMMSPVGQHYAPQVDWERAAAARAWPAWMLVVVFVVTIGVALGATVLVAKLVR